MSSSSLSRGRAFLDNKVATVARFRPEEQEESREMLNDKKQRWSARGMTTMTSGDIRRCVSAEIPQMWVNSASTGFGVTQPPFSLGCLLRKNNLGLFVVFHFPRERGIASRIEKYYSYIYMIIARKSCHDFVINGTWESLDREFHKFRRLGERRKLKNGET